MMEFGTMRAGRGDDGTRIVYETKKKRADADTYPDAPSYNPL